MKHIPVRTCVACRESKPKRELVRVVRVSEQVAEVDTTGKKNGRGSYLCPAQECWKLAEKKRSLNHALEMTITPENWQALWEYAEGLPEQKVLKRAERAAAEAAPEGEEKWQKRTNKTRAEVEPLSKNRQVAAP